MIIKNFEIDKFKKSNSNLHLIYGVNEGIKQDLINNIYLKGYEGDIFNYEEHEILNNIDQFISNLLTKSLFSNKKIIIISDNNIKFEGINLEAPQHLSKLTEDGLKIGLRSSDIELNENGHEFEVELAEISGSETLLHLKRGDTKIIVSIEEVLNFKIHDKVKIRYSSLELE